jgi:hypothetical protein
MRSFKITVSNSDSNGPFIIKDDAGNIVKLDNGNDANNIPLSNLSKGNYVNVVTEATKLVITNIECGTTYDLPVPIYRPRYMPPSNAIVAPPFQ